MAAGSAPDDLSACLATGPGTDAARALLATLSAELRSGAYPSVLSVCIVNGHRLSYISVVQDRRSEHAARDTAALRDRERMLRDRERSHGVPVRLVEGDTADFGRRAHRHAMALSGDARPAWLEVAPETEEGRLEIDALLAEFERSTRALAEVETQQELLGFPRGGAMPRSLSFDSEESEACARRRVVVGVIFLIVAALSALAAYVVRPVETGSGDTEVSGPFRACSIVSFVALVGFLSAFDVRLGY
jgi:hypothetical protein